MLMLLKKARFIAICCEQVVAVFVLVLESNAAIVDLQAKNNASGPLFNIPLAGFVLGKLFWFLTFKFKCKWGVSVLFPIV